MSNKKKVIFINARDLGKKAGGTRVFLEKTLTEMDVMLTGLDSVKVIALTPDSYKHKFKNIQVINTSVTNSVLYDIFLTGYYTIKHQSNVVVGTKCITPPIPFIKKISVIYDLGAFRGSDIYHWTQRVKIIAVLFIGRVYTQKYIAISNSTKQDLVKYLKINPRAVKVVRLGPGIVNKSNPSKPIPDLPDNFLLFTGNDSKRKNLSRIIEALDFCKSNHNLVLTGYSSMNPADPNADRRIKRQSNLFKLNQVSPEELAFLYSKANLFLYPSLHEGFGLPILEAQNFCLPVITSNLASMPEVAGDGAILVDPYSSKEIAQAINKLDDKRVRKSLIKQGKLNTKKYSWKKTAQDFIDLCLED